MKNRKITMKTQLKPSEALAVAAVFLASMLLGLILNSELLGTVEIFDVSMQDTLYEGERLFMNKAAYRNELPRRGDIVIFLKEETISGFFHRFRITSEDLFLQFTKGDRKNRLIKRVVGLPGDIVEIKDGGIYIDYIPLDEDYTKGVTTAKRGADRFKVPEGYVFVLGDNRPASNDSRGFGFVDLDSIEGKAVFRYWPFREFEVFKESYYD